MPKAKSSEDVSENFSYRGKDIAIKGSGEKATITIEGQSFRTVRRSGMWSSEGVFNHYKEPGDLARHIIDYLHLFTPEG